MKLPIPFTSRALVLRVEPHPRRPVRLRISPRPSIRGLMIAVAALALALGGSLALRRAERRAAFRGFEQAERRMLGEAGRAEREGRIVEAAKARFFAAEAGRNKARILP